MSKWDADKLFGEVVYGRQYIDEAIFLADVGARQVDVKLRERFSCSDLFELALTCARSPSVTVALYAPSTEQRHVGPPSPPLNHFHHPVLCFLTPDGLP